MLCNRKSKYEKAEESPVEMFLEEKISKINKENELDYSMLRNEQIGKPCFSHGSTWMRQETKSSQNPAAGLKLSHQAVKRVFSPQCRQIISTIKEKKKKKNILYICRNFRNNIRLKCQMRVWKREKRRDHGLWRRGRWAPTRTASFMTSLGLRMGMTDSRSSRITSLLPPILLLWTLPPPASMWSTEVGGEEYLCY